MSEVVVANKIKQIVKKCNTIVFPRTVPVRAFIFGNSRLNVVKPLANGNIRITSGITAPLQIRSGYTDIRCPDFTKYRRSDTKYPDTKTADTDVTRKIVPYLVSTSFAIASAYCTKAHLLHYVLFMDASAEVLALAKIEIKLSDIPEGKSATFKWRGKPLFVFHRSAETIETVRAVPLSILRDPEPDENRVKKAEWLVVLGICTHLGCVPIANAGDFGGYYCPCHGSHFDASGRARKGPAPTNLEVPEHSFLDDNTLLVG